MKFSRCATWDVTWGAIVEAARYYFFSFHLPVLYLPSKIINGDNKEKTKKRSQVKRDHNDSPITWYEGD